MVTKIFKVEIDPGHGGTAPGNVNFGLKEKDTTLLIAQRVGHWIRAMSWNPALSPAGPQIKTLFTRESDIDVGIDQRACKAVQDACDLMLSIHTDSSVNLLARGASAYVSARNEHHQSSSGLAVCILAYLSEIFKLRGVHDDTATHVGSLGVLRETCSRMDAVLVECGFASNLSDRKILTSADGREQIAKAIARAVVEHFGLSADRGLSEFGQSQK